jgi:hypothetical protein
VLDKRLQDGDTIPKWKPRSWLGVYVGHSLQHAGNVPVIYNPSTTHVSPQIHVVFVEQFSTINGNNTTLPDSFYTKLQDTFAWKYDNTIDKPSNIYTFDSYWSSSTLPPALPNKKRSASQSTSSTNVTTSHNDVHPPPTRPRTSSPTIISDQSEHAILNSSEHAPNKCGEQAPNSTQSKHAPQTKHYINLHALLCSDDLTLYKKENGIHADVYTTTSTKQPQASSLPQQPTTSDLFSLLTYTDIPDAAPSTPTTTMALDPKNDTLTQSQMLKADDCDKFVASQVDEINGLSDLDIMDIKHISKLPPKARLLSSIWSYK